MPEDTQLQKLSLLHFALGALMFATFPLVFLLSLYISPHGVWGGTLTLLGFFALLVLAVALMASSRAIDMRKWRIFSLICGILALPLLPAGTAIGIYTLLVLMRQEAIASYAQGKRYWHV
ncbi:MAG: hypothetical protein NZ765_05405 [Anaerolineae bacterium]|nr:hypothetical protein [Anaerolineae bacterium]MDW8071035.1 hypothetical protein [Anaerolineae bacterium]